MEFQSPPPPLRALLLFLLLLLLFITLFPPPSFALNHEALALLSFKSSIAEDPHASMATWNSSNGDPCSWNGVTCSEGKVVSITLPKSSLLGSLSPTLGSLSSLRHVNLRSNRLRGTLPSGLFAAARLQSLVLFGNSFAGPIPPELGDLHLLQNLDLSQNSLDGAIPASITQCSRLKVLDLSHNRLTSSIPFGFGGNLTALEKMNLSYNRLNGSLPEDLGNLSNIRGTLDLSHNLFSGPIPPSLGNLPENVYIDISFNNLSGSIPQTGALANRGPTAFSGNPNLCGPPLKKPCSSILGTAPSNSTQFPSLPSDGSPLASELGEGRGRNGLSKAAVIAIVVSDVVAIGLMAMLLLYCYRKAVSSKTKEDSENADGYSKGGKKYFCCGRDESDSNNDRVEQFHLISLDKQVFFDMDKLLKGSAYVMERSEIGIIYKVVLEDGLTLLIRRLNINRSQRFTEFQKEVEAIGKVRHPNIVLLRAYYWSVDEKLLIYDYIPNGNLSDAIHGNAATTRLSRLSWDHRLKIMKGLAKGLAFLHEFSPRKYVHGDLKPSNILLGSDMEPYISGFGLGHLANVNTESRTPPIFSSEKATENQQTPISNGSVSPIWSNSMFYRAPEALKSFRPSQKWDVYSFGAILLELISGRSPAVLMDTSEMDIVHWVQISTEGQKSLLHVVDPYLTRERRREDEITTALKLALSCVQFDPENRPSMRHVADSFDKLTL